MDSPQTPPARAPQPAAPIPPPSTFPQNSDHPKSAVFVGALALLVIVLAAGAWFVWPGPQMHIEQMHQETRAAFDSNDFAGALAHVDTLLAENPNDAVALTFRALVLAQQGSLTFAEAKFGSEAVAAAQAAVAADPTYSEAYRALAYAYEIQQDYANAHINYEKAIELDPMNSVAIFGNAHAHDLQGNLVEAEAGYRAALDMDPSLAAAHEGLGRIYAGQGDLVAAIEEFKAAYELTTNAHTKAEAAASLASLYLDTEDLVAAEEQAKIATEANPSYPLAWYVLGLVYMNKMSDTSIVAEDRFALLQQGLSANGQALKLYPSFTIAHIQQAKTFFYIFQNRTEALSSLANAERAADIDITLNTIGKTTVKAEIEALRALIQASK